MEDDTSKGNNLEDFLSVETRLEVEEVFHSVMEADALMDYRKLPIALKSLGDERVAREESSYFKT